MVVGVLITVQPVVQSRHVHRWQETRCHSVVRAVAALCDGACGVQLVTQVLQVGCHLASASHALLRNLVAYAPHNDAGVVAVGHHQVGDVLVGPFFEEACVAVFALGIYPHVEALGHDHHAQRVADVHLPLRRHVVRGAYGVASHLLHGLDLANEGGLVDGST